jgi:carbonic anhydrase
VARLNVNVALHDILAGSPILANMVQGGEVGIVSGIYDVKTGVVSFLDREQDSSLPVAKDMAASARAGSPDPL